MSGVKCPKCDREFWAVYRKRTKTEYRLVDTISSQVKTGHKKYKGNWKTEETTQSKIMGMRCMACSYETDGNDLEGCSGIEIDNKGVMFISDFWEKFGVEWENYKGDDDGKKEETQFPK